MTASSALNPVILQHLVFAVEQHGAPTHAIDLWTWVLAIATLLGGLAAVQQIIKSVRRRREDAALTKLLGAIADSTDADAARAELDRVLQSLETSKRALEDDVPRQARILFLENRRQALIDGITSDYRALERTSQELEALSEPSLPAIADLPASVRNAIETLVLRSESTRGRESRMLRLLIGLLVVTLLLPVSPSALVYEYFSVVSNGSSYSQGTVWGATLLGGLFVCGVLYWPGYWLITHLRGWRGSLTTAVISVLAGAATVGLGIILQDSLNQVYSLYDETTNISFTSGPDSAIQTCAILITLAVGVLGAAILPPIARNIGVHRRRMLARLRNGSAPQQAEG